MSCNCGCECCDEKADRVTALAFKIRSSRIEEWAKERYLLWRKFMEARPGQKIGVDFTLEEIPSVELDLPSLDMARALAAKQIAELDSLQNNVSVPRV